MSIIALSSNTLGSGTFTVASPNSNTNRTLTLPDASGTLLSTATSGVPIGGPAFSAYQSVAQSISGSVTTKINFQTEEFDTNSNFDTTTSRFTPAVAGYYLAVCAFFCGTTGSRMQATIFKNGSAYKAGANIGTADGQAFSALVFLNGSSDYIEGYAFIGVTQNLSTGISNTYFQAAMVRSAT
jgi:hypothetical protein